MALRFFYRRTTSAILGTIYRPVAKVLFWSKKGNYWSEIWMIVDSGADYTLLPRYLAKDLRVDLEKECQIFSTQGIGGTEKVYFSLRYFFLQIAALHSKVCLHLKGEGGMWLPWLN